MVARSRRRQNQSDGTL